MGDDFSEEDIGRDSLRTQSEAVVITVHQSRSLLIQPHVSCWSVAPEGNRNSPPCTDALASDSTSITTPLPPERSDPAEKSNGNPTIATTIEHCTDEDGVGSHMITTREPHVHTAATVVVPTGQPRDDDGITPPQVPRVSTASSHGDMSSSNIPTVPLDVSSSPTNSAVHKIRDGGATTNTTAVDCPQQENGETIVAKGNSMNNNDDDDDSEQITATSQIQTAASVPLPLEVEQEYHRALLAWIQQQEAGGPASPMTADDGVDPMKKEDAFGGTKEMEEIEKDFAQALRGHAGAASIPPPTRPNGYLESRGIWLRTMNRQRTCYVYIHTYTQSQQATRPPGAGPYVIPFLFVNAVLHNVYTASHATG